jgi:phosphoribosylanthranilate isomerase
MSVFLNLDLDFLCAVRTPPQHSWKNPVERIMSILNLALQGVGVMREAVPHEDELKRCGSLKTIRAMADKVPEIKDEVLQSVRPTIELLSTLMQRMKLKEHSFQTHSSASEEDVENLWREVLKVKVLKR